MYISHYQNAFYAMLGKKYSTLELMRLSPLVFVCTVNSEIFREGFIFAKVSWKLNPREIAKSLSRLLI